MKDLDETPHAVEAAIRQLLRCHKRMLIAHGKTRKSSVAQMRQVHERLYRMVIEYKKRNRVLKNGYRHLDAELNSLRFSFHQSVPTMSIPKSVTIMRDQSTSTTDGQSSMVLFRRMARLETENVKLRKSQDDLLNVFSLQPAHADAISSAISQNHRHADIRESLIQADLASLSLPVMPSDSIVEPNLPALQSVLQQGVEHMLGNFERATTSILSQTDEYASRVDVVRGRIEDCRRDLIPKAESVLAQAEQCKNELGQLRCSVSDFFVSAQSEMQTQLQRVLNARCDRSQSVDVGIQVKASAELRPNDLQTKSICGDESCSDYKHLLAKYEILEAKYTVTQRNSRAAEQALADIYSGLGVPLPDYPVPFRNGRYAVADRELSRMLGALRDVTLEATDIGRKHVRGKLEKRITHPIESHQRHESIPTADPEVRHEVRCPILHSMEMVSQWKIASSNAYLYLSDCGRI